eukprot:TRINITY_DN2243_c0_g1_i1.p1 TRINITY_DN2243_c0_g1~~TRINITY_DN2243_c0_g1_i1.p1  ORF type:complete len:372 (+),score=68.41 TRINITY_DN2243_c0_g1_i1:49-1116(+)
MKAVRLLSEKGKDDKHVVKVVSDAPIPTLLSGRRDALVRIQAAALNHRDNWMTMGLYPRMKYGSVLGSDGCGVVVAVSDQQDVSWQGKGVVIDPSMSWGPSIRASDKSFTILGMPVDGTFAEFIKVPIENLRESPSHLTPDQSAALPLAGGTAYRALVTKGEVSTGDAVLITGIGGGVALFALQFAVSLGCRVYVTSGSETKLKKAVSLGATFGVNYKTKGWETTLKKRIQKDTGGFDCVIDGAGGTGLNQYFKMMKSGGRVVSYGSTAGASKPFVMANIFLNNIDVKGTAMCSPQEFTDMLRLVNEQKIVPIVDTVMSLSKVNEGIDRMRQGNQFGKIILSPEAVLSGKKKSKL